MAKGYSDIPQLHQVFLRKLAVNLDAMMPTMQFSKYFGEINIPTDEAVWEYDTAGQGISPFVAPGAPAPTIGTDGLASGSAKVAYWKEKAFLDEVHLNNLRRVGDVSVHENASRIMGRQMTKLIARNKRRKEWMCARAIIDGRLTYIGAGGTARFSVDYGRPAANSLVLAENRKWGSGADRNPVEDIFDAKIFMADTYGINVTELTITTETLKRLMLDSKVQDLLKKSAFGDGNLFSQPAQVLGSLLGIGTLNVNDEMFSLTSDIVGFSGNTITVDNATDYEVGSKVYLERSVERFRTVARVITKVDPVNGVITLNDAFPATPVPGKDRLFITRKFMDDNKVVLHTPSFQGVPTGEFYRSPFGIPTHYGLFTDSEPEWDPDGVYLRVQDKGLPVLYAPQASFTITVA